MTRCAPLLLIAAGSGCIIPDSDIVLEGEFTNRNPVRIVEPAELSAEADDACAAETEVDICPGFPQSGLLPFYDPDTHWFCSCNRDAGEVDSDALERFELLVEDADSNEGVPRDSLYAAFLLDVDAQSGRPIYENVAYTSAINPDREAIVYNGEYSPIGRPKPFLRQFIISDTNQKLDLCNGATLEALTPGWHTITVMVTDRRWFVPTIIDENGEETPGNPQPGVPDLANGATYDSTTTSFFCRARDEFDELNSCPDRCDPSAQEG